MHRVPSPDDVAAKRGADALMTKADTENRRRRAEALHDLGGDAGFLRRAGPRGDDDVAWREPLDVRDGHFIAATHDPLFAQLADVAGEVVDERVAIVEQQNHLAIVDS